MIEADRHARLKELFGVALELPTGERQAFVDQLRGQEAELAAELRELLAHHEERTDEAFADLGRVARAQLASGHDDLEGRRLGPYLLLRTIGQGGMGRVFLAERADDSYRQKVAVKLLRTPLPSPELVQRFRLERQTLANLSHPAIARLLDGGETPEGWPYLVLEFVDGEAIDRYCEGRRLDLRQRLALFLEVCEAVEHAHRKLIVHRDLKPSNILVTTEGQVKLLDFGIAKLLAAPEAAAGLTRTYERVLTPEFAAPEQIRGGSISTATDVYSLGVLLFRLLTGAHPYDLTSEAPSEFERVICETPPLRPSAALIVRQPQDARRVRELAGDLDNIVLMALRKEPERRYPTVGELAADLRRHLEYEPVAARGDTFAYRAAKFVRRHRAGVAAALIAALALVGGAVVSLWQAQRAAAERDRAQSEAARAARMSEFLQSALTVADPARGKGRETTVAELLDGAAQRLDQELAQDPEAASFRLTLGQTYRNLGLPAEAEREYRKALTSTPGTSSRRTVRTAHGAHARALLAVALNDQGRWSEAEAEARGALALLGESREDSRVRALVLDALDVGYVHLGRNAEAIAAGREAVALLRGDPQPDSVQLASALNNLAVAYGDGGRFAEAEPLHREALALIRSVRGDQHPQSAEALANLAAVVEMQGRKAAAEPLYREALQVLEQVLGEGHFDFVRTLTSYANLLVLLERPMEAEGAAARALDLARQHLGERDQLTAYAANTLALALLEEGKPRAAGSQARVALTVREALLPAGHWLIASSRATLGAALLDQDRLAEAEPELLEAHRALVAARGRDHEKSRYVGELLARLEAAKRE